MMLGSDLLWCSLVQSVVESHADGAALQQDVWCRLRNRSEYYLEHRFFAASGDGRRARKEIAEMVREILDCKETDDANGQTTIQDADEL